MEQRLTRKLPLEGAYNVRDLGGYRTSGGGSTCWNTFLRGDSLHRLEDNDIHTLVGYGVRTIVDLREPEEVRQEPDRLAAVPGVTVHHIPLLAELMPAMAGAALPTDLGELYVLCLKHGGGALKRVFELFGAADGAGESADRFAAGAADGARTTRPPRSDAAEAVRVAGAASPPGAASSEGAAPCLRAGGAVLFHCAIGKDRTGVVAALLLELLGVPRPLILEDYRQSEEHLQPLLAELARRYARDPATGVHPDLLRCLPQNLERMLDFLQAEYGGAAGYLQWAGVPEPVVRAIRARARCERGDGAEEGRRPAAVAGRS